MEGAGVGAEITRFSRSGGFRQDCERQVESFSTYKQSDSYEFSFAYT